MGVLLAQFSNFYGPDSGIIFPRLILFCKCSRWWIWWWHIWSNSGHGPNNENREGGLFWLNTEQFISQFSRFTLCQGSFIFCFTFTFLLPLHHHNRKSKSLDISSAKPPTWASTFDNLERKQFRIYLGKLNLNLISNQPSWKLVPQGRMYSL